MSRTQYYNDGNPDVGPMLTDYAISKIVIREAAKRKIFTQLAPQIKMKRNMGSTFKQERRFPILHKENINSQGVDPDGLELLPTKWYSWDAAGVRQEHDTKAEAKARAGMVRFMSGQGNLYGGSRDFFQQVGSVPTLRESGGRVNEVGVKRIIISARIKLYSIAEVFSRQQMELDNIIDLQKEKSMEVGVAQGDLREAMIRNDLIGQGLTNALYGGTNIASMDAVDETCELTYAKLRAFQLHLDLLRVPMQTKILKGTTKIDTKVVNKARYLFIPLELETAFENLQRNGRDAFIPYAQYAEKDTVADEGELGSVGKFRIISDIEIPFFAGAGADATDGADNDGDGIEDAGADFYMEDGHYSAFPILSVGTGAYSTLGLKGDDTSVKFTPPMIIPGIDNTGEIGVVSARWYYGILFHRPEWVNMLVVSAKK